MCVGELTQEEIENLNSSVTIKKLEYFPSLSANIKNKRKQNKKQKNKPTLNSNGFTDTFYQNLRNKSFQPYTNVSKNI